MLPTTPIKFIYHFAKHQWFKFLISALISIAWALNDGIFPYFLKRIINTLSTYHGDPQQVYTAVGGVLLLIVIFWVVMEFLQRIQGILQIYAFPKFRAQIRFAVFNYIKAHSHDFYASEFAGNIAKKLSDLPNSCQMIVEIICLQFVTATAFSAIAFWMMYHVNPIFAGILFIWLSIHMGITFLSLRYGNYLWERHSESVSALSGKVVDVLTNNLTMRLFARGDYESEYLYRFQQKEILRSQKAGWFMEITRIFLGINGLFLIFGMIFTLLYGWSHGWVSIGDFTQVGMQTFWMLGWIWYISYQMNVFTRELGTISNSLLLIQKGHDVVDVVNAKPLKIKKGEIDFERVSFEYAPERKIFSGLTIKISAGKKIGLVGYSGSGKSTFVNLILRFYDLQGGKILIDGQDIARVQQESLRQHIAMIPQEPMLFHRTLMDNIRYGRLDATDEEVIAAAKLAHCHEFIIKMDEGYQALVGERGVKLSGGQRQRIAIARAILKNAPILILDEATSSLDSVTEKLIQKSMNYLMRKRTTLVVAHRLATLTDMDWILVFDKGRLVEEGTKDELLEKNGHFARLWNLQTDGFLPDTDDTE